jgi:hypothetical protein
LVVTLENSHSRAEIICGTIAGHSFHPPPLPHSGILLVLGTRTDPRRCKLSGSRADFSNIFQWCIRQLHAAAGDPVTADGTSQQAFDAQFHQALVFSYVSFAVFLAIFACMILMRFGY